MQKLTKTEIRSIICELESIASDCMQFATRSGNAFDREYFRGRADNLHSIAEKLRLALVNEDKRIEIV